MVKSKQTVKTTGKRAPPAITSSALLLLSVNVDVDEEEEEEGKGVFPAAEGVHSTQDAEETTFSAICYRRNV